MSKVVVFIHICLVINVAKAYYNSAIEDGDCFRYNQPGHPDFYNCRINSPKDWLNWKPWHKWS